jgi:hypothetical protein
MVTITVKNIFQAQCDGREGRESSYGKRRKRRQIRKNGIEKDEDFSLKEMFRVFENRDEISTGCFDIYQ